MKETLSGIQKGLSVLREQSQLLPDAPGIYKMLGKDSKLLYIGKAKSLIKRVSSYADLNRLSNRIKMMVSQIEQIDFITTNSESEALLLEANLINQFKPPYNINLKDDKSFPYIFFDESHEYPRITKYRGNKSIKGKYYGPFASVGQIKQTIIELQKMFLIRPCSNSFFASRIRPCIQYEIKRCSGPCVGKISSDLYKKQITMAKQFLEGDGMDVHKNLVAEMEEASSSLEFERAAQIRDKIKILSAIQAKNLLTDIGKLDIDVVGISFKSNTLCIQVYFIRAGKNFGNKSYYYEDVEELDIANTAYQFILRFYENHIPPKEILIGSTISTEEVSLINIYLRDKYKIKVTIKQNSRTHKDLLEFAEYNAKVSLEKHLKERLKTNNMLTNISRLFGATTEINRIEIYDNSHISGTNAIGAMVVYSKNGFNRKEYRTYNIKNTNIADDYAMLEETLTRRLSNLSDENTPDLLLVDGGLGHLKSAMKVLNDMKVQIPLVCISKGKDRNAGREFFHMQGKDSFQLPVGDPTLHFLQVLRDEAHKHAIKSHRSRRSREISKSSIDAIPGIGDVRKKALLQYFGSAEAIMSASISDIEKVTGISKIIAKNIFNYLHPSK